MAANVNDNMARKLEKTYEDGSKRDIETKEKSRGSAPIFFPDCELKINRLVYK